MKLSMNLLPEKYICLPRDWMAIYILIVFTLISVGGFFGLQKYYEKKLNEVEQIDSNAISQLESQIMGVEQDIRRLKNDLETDILERHVIEKINRRILFSNTVFQQDFSWYHFFDFLERVTPEGVWVKDIAILGSNISDIRFILTCEASKPFLAPDFFKNLTIEKEFVKPFLSDIAINPDTFGNTFSLNFQFYPIKEAWSNPGTIETQLNQRVPISILGKNLKDETRVFGEENYEAVVTSRLGFFESRQETFLALSTGVGELLINFPSRPELNFSIPVVVKP